KEVTWTRGIDPKTGKPIDYDPKLDVQIYNEGAGSVVDATTRQICPSITGGTNFWPVSYSRKTGYLYIPAYEGCGKLTVNGKAYIAISSGVCCVRPSGAVSNALAGVRRNPELKNQTNASVLYVFGL